MPACLDAHRWQDAIQYAIVLAANSQCTIMIAERVGQTVQLGRLKAGEDNRLAIHACMLFQKVRAAKRSQAHD